MQNKQDLCERRQPSHACIAEIARTPDPTRESEPILTANAVYVTHPVMTRD